MDRRRLLKRISFVLAMGLTGGVANRVWESDKPIGPLSHDLMLKIHKLKPEEYFGPEGIGTQRNFHDYLERMGDRLAKLDKSKQEIRFFDFRKGEWSRMSLRPFIPSLRHVYELISAYDRALLNDLIYSLTRQKERAFFDHPYLHLSGHAMYELVKSQSGEVRASQWLRDSIEGEILSGSLLGPSFYGQLNSYQRKQFDECLTGLSSKALTGVAQAAEEQLVARGKKLTRDAIKGTIFGMIVAGIILWRRRRDA